MTQEEPRENLSSKEKLFRFYMTHGEDFLKIEIFRNARKYYKLAMDMNINNEAVNEKIKQCNNLIKKENKSIVTILIIIAAVICVVAGFKIF